MSPIFAEYQRPEDSMARRFLPGISSHVYHRGNNRMTIFQEAIDCEIFLTMLEDAANRHGTSVHAFVIMTTHFHLIATPSSEISLASTMKQLGERYTNYYNRRHNRTGTIWDGRYRAKHLLEERYWLTCLRYVEQNPVRARMVRSPATYRWSSYGVHALGHAIEWLVLHSLYLSLGATADERQAAYRAICAESLPEADLVCVRNNWVARKRTVELATV
jgi:REP-associated tyrosine transposase